MAIQARKKLRDIMRSKRKLLCTTTAEAAAKAAAEKLLNLPMLKNCQHIGVYLSNDGEIQTDFLIHELHLLGKACYLPVLDTHQFHHLQFAKYIPGESLTKNRYQISEPYLSEQNACLPPLLDLVLIPVVAFDKQGNRLGMGGGYYDRTFAFTKKLPAHRPLLIGFAYEFQCVDHIEAELWDIPLQAIVTEKTVFLNPVARS